MLIVKQVDEDLKNAMRAKDAAKLGVLRLLKSALKNAAIEKGEAEAVLDDAEALSIIRKQVKQRQDSIEGYEKGGRAELADAERAEMLILQNYLPAALSPAEITALVTEAIAEVGAVSRQQMGEVMKIVSAKAAGRADGRALSAEVQRQLLT
ncbi:MAG: GatB/YqeY domain-containing protein [Terrimicrobiaceae bacterium]